MSRRIDRRDKLLIPNPNSELRGRLTTSLVGSNFVNDLTRFLRSKIKALSEIKSPTSESSPELSSTAKRLEEKKKYKSVQNLDRLKRQETGQQLAGFYTFFSSILGTPVAGRTLEELAGVWWNSGCQRRSKSRRNAAWSAGKFCRAEFLGGKEWGGRQLGLDWD